MGQFLSSALPLFEQLVFVHGPPVTHLSCLVHGYWKTCSGLDVPLCTVTLFNHEAIAYWCAVDALQGCPRNLEEHHLLVGLLGIVHLAVSASYPLQKKEKFCYKKEKICYNFSALLCPEI